MRITIQGRINTTYTLEATDDLDAGTNIVWTPISTNTTDLSGKVGVLDTNAPTHSQRFYRAYN